MRLPGINTDAYARRVRLILLEKIITYTPRFCAKQDATGLVSPRTMAAWFDRLSARAVFVPAWQVRHGHSAS